MSYSRGRRLVGLFARPQYVAYTKPATVKDEVSGKRFRSYATYAFGFARQSDGTPVLLTAGVAHYHVSESDVTTRAERGGYSVLQTRAIMRITPDALEIGALAFQVQPQLGFYRCTIYAHYRNRATLVVAEGRTYPSDSRLERLWPRVKRASDCG